MSTAQDGCISNKPVRVIRSLRSETASSTDFPRNRLASRVRASHERVAVPTVRPIEGSLSSVRQNATDRSSCRDDIRAEVVRLLASNLGTCIGARTRSPRGPDSLKRLSSLLRLRTAGGPPSTWLAVGDVGAGAGLSLAGGQPVGPASTSSSQAGGKASPWARLRIARCSASRTMPSRSSANSWTVAGEPSSLIRSSPL